MVCDIVVVVTPHRTGSQAEAGPRVWMAARCDGMGMTVTWPGSQARYVQRGWIRESCASGADAC